MITELPTSEARNKMKCARYISFTCCMTISPVKLPSVFAFAGEEKKYVLMLVLV